ncbi:hypothetical protein HELRODRAFT_167048 [Helobdella robusta]|uniref:Uncharacterized protein n=1 Tax=Helobdella robusta TaxID=6412 RepID=T1EYY1_HELRO|nr:hypothetical protein HELRODRAFT_167048 [Helobdella robusta]ESO10547.1 hypothetical protein HELRODRAFT_167048 [Helobdella robusta]
MSNIDDVSKVNYERKKTNKKDNDDRQWGTVETGLEEREEGQEISGRKDSMASSTNFNDACITNGSNMYPHLLPSSSRTLPFSSSSLKKKTEMFYIDDSKSLTSFSNPGFDLSLSLKEEDDVKADDIINNNDDNEGDNKRQTIKYVTSFKSSDRNNMTECRRSVRDDCLNTGEKSINNKNVTLTAPRTLTTTNFTSVTTFTTTPVTTNRPFISCINHHLDCGCSFKSKKNICNNNNGNDNEDGKNHDDNKGIVNLSLLLSDDVDNASRRSSSSVERSGVSSISTFQRSYELDKSLANVIALHRSFESSPYPRPFLSRMQSNDVGSMENIDIVFQQRTAL